MLDEDTNEYPNANKTVYLNYACEKVVDANITKDELVDSSKLATGLCNYCKNQVMKYSGIINVNSEFFDEF